MGQDVTSEAMENIHLFGKKISMINRFFNTTATLAFKISDEKILAANFDGLLDPFTALFSSFEAISWNEGLQRLYHFQGLFHNHLLLNHILLLEKMFKVTLEIPKRATYLRTVLLEFERIISHLQFLANIAQAFSFPFLEMKLLTFKRKLEHLEQELTTSSTNKPFIVLGGVQTRKSSNDIQKILEQLNKLWQESTAKTKTFKRNRVIRKALQDVGFITREDAKRFSFVGPLARSTGITEDLRKSDPYLAYSSIDFSIPVSDDCDVFGEVMVRIDEIQESFKICNQLLNNLPTGPLQLELPSEEKIATGIKTNRLETPAGELFTFILNKEKTLQKSPRVYQVTSPFKINQQGALLRLLGETMENLNLLVATLSEGWSDK